MANNNQKKGSGILDIFVVLLILFCLVADAIFIYYKFFAPKTFTEDVAYIGEVTDINENSKMIFEIEYFENADKSGVELFEFKLNYLTDHEKQSIYTSGVQYVGTPIFEEKISSGISGFLFLTVTNYLNVAENVYFYNFDNNTNLAYERENPITNKEYFSITIGEDLFKLTFKEKIFYSNFLGQNVYAENIHSLSEALYTGVQSLGYGTTPLTFKFQDMFEILKYDEDKNKYVDATDADAFTSYVVMNVTKHKEGAKSASDSMFGCVAGNANWVSAGVDTTKTYEINETYYLLTENNIKFTFSEEKGYHIGSINEATYNTLKDTTTPLKLVINKDNLTNLDIIFGELSSTYLEELGLTKYYVIENGITSEVVVC